MKVFTLPDLGEGLPDATVVRWLVSEGDTVSVDQPMVEMETAKAVVEVPSPYTGVVKQLNGKPGDVIQVGADLVLFEVEGESKTVSAPSSSNQTLRTEAGDRHLTTTSQVFLLPDLGEGLQDAGVVRWLKQEGDTVSVDEPLVEMETDKAVVEVPSPYAGVISKLHGNPGDVILVGQPLAEFNSPSGSASANTNAPPADAGTVVGAVQVGNEVVAETSSAIVKALARKLKVDLNQVKGTGANGQITQNDVKQAAKQGTRLTASANVVAPSVGTDTQNPLAYRASPAVRALAKKLDVDLASCQATGKKGSITREDVHSAAKGGAPKPAAASPQASAHTPSTSSRLGSVNVSPEPIKGVRRAMAAAMSKARDQVCLTTIVDDANIHYWKPGNNPTVRLIRALARACRIEPALNAWFDGENMERLIHPNVHIGIAVDMPDGLYVPVIRDADRKSAQEIRQDLNNLIDKIKTKTIRPEDMANPTITLSNFGTIAGKYATPVVVPPQVAIVGSGSFQEILKLTEKGIENQKHIPISLSFDHRACTGGEAARCLKAMLDDLSLKD